MISELDKRFGITPEEKEKVLANYFKRGLTGSIETIPSKEKRKVIILQHIIERFSKDRTYSEKEVNEVLKTVHEDFVSLRRYLIDYRLMERNKDGNEYRVIM